MNEKRSFKLASNMIYHFIEAQAGTLGKAFLEYIMNSVDSSSTRIDIVLDAKGFTVTDDGIGFRGIDEIEEFFETFGFNHGEESHRTYGKFGMGRAQMWSFASTVWRTGTYEMSVDIKNKGLDYDLKRSLPAVQGCVIRGAFYEEQMPSDLNGVLRELEELATYTQIPVTINGKLLNLLPQKEKWTVETDDAYIRLTGTGTLRVYNLGVLVRHYPMSQFGVAGVVVSKKPLDVNFARNDILVAKCPVWKRLRKYLQEQSTRNNRAKPRLNDEERQNLVNQLLSGDLVFEDAVKLKLVTDTTGRHWPLSKLEIINRSMPITVAPEEGDRIAERLHLAQAAFVLSPVSLERFGAATVEQFVAAVRRMGIKGGRGEWYLDSVEVASFAVLAKVMANKYEVIPTAELEREERVLLNALRDSQLTLLHGDGCDWSRERREIVLGVSETADGWTDGARTIALNREFVKRTTRDKAGFVKIGLLLLHEYVHDNNDTGSHRHDMDFYNLYHDVVSSASNPIGQFASWAFYRYMKGVERAGIKLKRQQLAELDYDAKLAKLCGYEGTAPNNMGEVAPG